VIVSSHIEHLCEWWSMPPSAHQGLKKAIIAGAGGAAHLPGMVALLQHYHYWCSNKSSNPIDGWDLPLSILQMPNGVPVATVA